MKSIRRLSLKTKEDSEFTTERTKVESVLRSLRTLLEGDEKEQQEIFYYLKQSLDEDCPSY